MEIRFNYVRGLAACHPHFFNVCAVKSPRVEQIFEDCKAHFSVHLEYKLF